MWEKAHVWHGWNKVFNDAFSSSFLFYFLVRNYSVTAPHWLLPSYYSVTASFFLSTPSFKFFFFCLLLWSLLLPNLEQEYFKLPSGQSQMCVFVCVCVCVCMCIYNKYEHVPFDQKTTFMSQFLLSTLKWSLEGVTQFCGLCTLWFFITLPHSG